MEVFKRHFETFTIVGSMIATVVCACMWLNGRFNEIDQKISDINVRLTRIETIMFLKGFISSDIISKLPEDKIYGQTAH